MPKDTEIAFEVGKVIAFVHIEVQDNCYGDFYQYDTTSQVSWSSTVTGVAITTGNIVTVIGVGTAQIKATFVATAWAAIPCLPGEETPFAEETIAVESFSGKPFSVERSGQNSGNNFAPAEVDFAGGLDFVSTFARRPRGPSDWSGERLARQEIPRRGRGPSAEEDLMLMPRIPYRTAVNQTAPALFLPTCGTCVSASASVSPSTNLTVISVTITKADGSPLPTIFRIGRNGGGNDRTQALKATVTPAGKAASITISVSSGITLSGVQTNSETGVITFNVVGKTESAEKGDASITAKGSSATLVTQKVSVVVPSKVATPHDTMGTFVAANRVLTATTSPPAQGAGPGEVELATIYARFLTITVKDQFNDLIGDIYAGAIVTETVGASNVSINQSLTSSSTYSDPVGLKIHGSFVVAESTAAMNWPTQSLLPMVSATATQNIPVQVDGFTLVPGIATRTWTSTPPNTLTISWPN